MKARLDPYQSSPSAIKAMYALEHAAQSMGIEPSLYELVKIRASQLNGCSYCVHMHSRDARKIGESENRVFMVSAWRESPLFTARERAALEWTEALTKLSRRESTEREYAILSESFSEEERVQLTLLIATINAWNRFGVGFQLIHPTEPD